MVRTLWALCFITDETVPLSSAHNFERIPYIVKCIISVHKRRSQPCDTGQEESVFVRQELIALTEKLQSTHLPSDGCPYFRAAFMLRYDGRHICGMPGVKICLVCLSSVTIEGKGGTQSVYQLAAMSRLAGTSNERGLKGYTRV